VTFGDLLRQYRLAAGLTQERLAERAGLSVRGISDLERGLKLRARKETIALLSNALRLTPEERGRLTAAARVRSESETEVGANGARGDGLAVPPEPGRRHNLPTQLTSFIGRGREVAAIQDQLRRARLLTLTGVGGVGKTRLALETAASLVEAFPDGVWLAELAPLADPSVLAQFIAGALGIPEIPGRSVDSAIVDYLRIRQTLLVLDNCEHLVEACAALVTTLIRTCPRLTVLATSREALGVPGEVAWPVPSLAIPDQASLPSDESTLLSEVMASAAVRLLVERARLVVPTFALTARNAVTLLQICRRLDGLPLAIELAAARMKLLTPEQIAERLEGCFEVLSAGSRMADDRHRTLWATIEWSYDLLAEPERALFRGLAVFAGGFTLDAAETVCAASLETLGQLADKSLVAVERPTSGAARYHLLETIRQFALTQLAAVSDAAELHRRHARYFVSLAESADRWLWAADGRAPWLNRLGADYDNFRAAISWSSHGGGDVEVAMRLVGALWWFWMLRDQSSEGRAYAETLLSRPVAPTLTEARARLLTSAGALAWFQNDYATARTTLESAVENWRAVGDVLGLATALTLLSRATIDGGDTLAATRWAIESVGRFRETDDAWGLAWALNNLGFVMIEGGDARRARGHLAESLEQFCQLGDAWGSALAQSNLGYLAYRLEEYAAARRHLESALTVFRAGNDHWSAPRALTILGNIARWEGDDAGAKQFYRESWQLSRRRDDQSGVAITRLKLARIARAEGDVPQAAMMLLQSLSVLQRLGDRPGVAECFLSLAGVAAQNQRGAEAVRLFAAAEGCRGAGAPPWWSDSRFEVERDLTLARAALSPSEFDAAWHEGRTLTVEEAIEKAFEIGRSTLSLADLPSGIGQAAAIEYNAT
jgi:predicted ATPase/transcriptional regulator with XRE-family HTH domain